MRRFESVVALLERRGYVAEWSLTAAGARLAAIYHECDLLLAEAIDAGLLEGLDAAELAAMVSCVTYEERRPDAPAPSAPPTPEVGRRIKRLGSLAEALRKDERASGLPPTREPDPGFVHAIHAWVSGDDLERVLEDERAPGDFVRNVKVVIDLLGQLGGPRPVRVDHRRGARGRSTSRSRGVVAASSEVGPQPARPRATIRDGSSRRAVG